VLTADPALPRRDLAWSRTEMAALLERALPGERVARVKREYTAYKAGKECLVLYALEPGAAPRSRHLAIVTFGSEERLRILHARHYAQAAPTVARLLADVPCLVELFPNDWKLPELAAAADASRMQGRLAPEEGSPEPRIRDVEVLRYRPRRRCVLRYRLEGGTGELVAKVYPYAWKAAEVSEKLRRLGPPALMQGLRLPRPIGVRGDSALVVMERVPGRNLGETLEATRGPAEARAPLEIAARALAAFHALPVLGGPPRSIEGELERLRARSARLEPVAPSLAGRLSGLLAALEQRLARARPAGACLIHGDYKPSQLLVERGEPALVDLDRACPGDPALDLGNFLAVLVKHALFREGEHLARLRGVFLQEYERQSGRPVEVERTELFFALALARMLVRKLERAPHALLREGEGWGPLALLDEAARVLAGREVRPC
jgi:aminoglycoside phosphotransferase (APT) family kinase protein